MIVGSTAARDCPARSNRGPDHALPTIIVASGAVIDLLPVRNVAGAAGQRPKMTVVRVACQKIGQLGHVLLADVAFGAHGVVKFHLGQAASAGGGVIAGNVLDAAGDFRRYRIVVAVLTLHASQGVDMVQVVTGQVGIDVILHDVAQSAEFRVGVALVLHFHPRQHDCDQGNNHYISDDTDF